MRNNFEEWREPIQKELNTLLAIVGDPRAWINLRQLCCDRPHHTGREDSVRSRHCFTEDNGESCSPQTVVLQLLGHQRSIPTGTTPQKDAHGTQPTEGEGLMWQVDRAVYGLVESPADWGVYRDEELHLMRWHVGDVVYKVKMTQEASIWKILREGDDDEVPQGYLANYVNDMLMVGPDPNLARPHGRKTAPNGSVLQRSLQRKEKI